MACARASAASASARAWSAASSAAWVSCRAACIAAVAASAAWAACSGLGEGDGGFGLGLAAGGVSGGQRRGDPAGVGGGQLGGSGGGQAGGLGEQLVQAGQRPAVWPGRRRCLLPPAAPAAERLSLCHLREHAGLQNKRGAPRPVAAGSSVPHPGCLQRRGPAAGAGGSPVSGPGSRALVR